ncbi:DUF616 domain-containing protein [Cephalotus follicularis]|uniref:DUF616 domain-containing protein n=1 Tax=Cephalotus follicularis TaxID=3775 RepID=A0A1Q3BIE2_CEPFO|nr:DUF616 domain-containing protein [Cephalotus follicularis]
MTGVSLGIRSGSYGSLDKQLQNGASPVLQTTRNKPAKMFKDKDRLFHWICKFAGRKKVGMLLLCVISAAVFVWVLYVGKGEDAQDSEHVNFNLNRTINYLGSSPTFEEQSQNLGNDSSRGIFDDTTMPPPPPFYFLGYTLPPGHPCSSFSLPPPPADKKRTGPRPCPVCYLPVEEAIALMPKVPSFSPVIKELTYIYEEELSKNGEFGGSDFGGYPTLKQRSASYEITENMTIHCGFVKGTKPGRNTGFDMDETDLYDMDQCRGVVVVSAIFGAFDDIQQPSNISDYSRKTVCFFMFVDEETEAYLKANGGWDSSRKIGIWRIVVIHNPPYKDGRRTGKIPKLLPHRLFPNATHSIWIDGKLELVVDPYQILERFLWRHNATFAISSHYRRYDVFTEAEANKAAGKYDNSSIDFQIKFYYENDGLTHYSEDKHPIISDVPEGCVVIREHVPISNHFACLWFNEVDRFTSRDQISFSTVRDKIRAKTNWTVYMFRDCERRNFVVQKYHRLVAESIAPPVAVYPPPLPPVLLDESRKLPLDASAEKVVRSIRKVLPRRRRFTRRHRKVVASDKET